MKSNYNFLTISYWECDNIEKILKEKKWLNQQVIA